MQAGFGPAWATHISKIIACDGSAHHADVTRWLNLGQEGVNTIRDRRGFPF